METNNLEPRLDAAKNRAAPKTGAEEHAEARDRTGELPIDNIEENRELIEKANQTANQSIDDEGVEVQGKAAVPRVKVQKRGSTKWSDDDGEIHKELNSAEKNAELPEPETPDYLLLHEAVLEGADPLEETLKYQGRKPEARVAEGREAKAESSPRTRGLGQGSGTENVQKAEQPVENKNDR